MQPQHHFLISLQSIRLKANQVVKHSNQIFTVINPTRMRELGTGRGRNKMQLPDMSIYFNTFEKAFKDSTKQQIKFFQQDFYPFYYQMYRSEESISKQTTETDHLLHLTLKPKIKHYRNN